MTKINLIQGVEVETRKVSELEEVTGTISNTDLVPISDEDGKLKKITYEDFSAPFVNGVRVAMPNTNPADFPDTEIFTPAKAGTYTHFVKETGTMVSTPWEVTTDDFREYNILFKRYENPLGTPPIVWAMTRQEIGERATELDPNDDTSIQTGVSVSKWVNENTYNISRPNQLVLGKTIINEKGAYFTEISDESDYPNTLSLLRYDTGKIVTTVLNRVVSDFINIEGYDYVIDNNADVGAIYGGAFYYEASEDDYISGWRNTGSEVIKKIPIGAKYVRTSGSGTAIGYTKIAKAITLEEDKVAILEGTTLKEIVTPGKNKPIGFSDFMDFSTAPTGSSRATILGQPVGYDSGVIKLNSLTEGYISLVVYERNELGRFRRIRQYQTKLNVGENVITMFPLKRGEYFGWFYDSTTRLARIAEGIATNYQSYTSASEINHLTFSSVTSVTNKSYGVYIEQNYIGLEGRFRELENTVKPLKGTTIGLTTLIAKATDSNKRYDHVHTCRMDDGRLLAVSSVFGTSGADYAASRIGIFISADNGNTWKLKSLKPTNPSISFLAESNPDLYKCEDGSFIIIYTAAVVSGIRRISRIKLSADAETWSDDIIITDNTKNWTPGGTGVVNDESRNRLLYPYYYSAGDGSSASKDGYILIMESEDDGDTWTDTGVLLNDSDPAWNGAFEPSIHILPNNDICVSVRSLSGHRRAMVSSDGGVTFGATFNLFRAPNSMSAIRKSTNMLIDGNYYYLAVANDIALHGNNRRALRLLISKDGLNWFETGKHVMNYELKVTGGYEPSIFFDALGVYVVWTEFATLDSSFCTFIPQHEIISLINKYL